MTKPYDPLDYEHLAESIANALLRQPVEPLPPAKAFKGTGLYALYYHGSFAPYARIANRNQGGQFAQPIYVGKAVPKGGRKGTADFESPTGASLHARLRKHARSIESTSNLSVDDFSCRYLVVAPVWVALGEGLLIDRFAPLWNGVVDGFGNNDPGKRRYDQLASLWDVLHPGRPWVHKLGKNPKMSEKIEAMIDHALGAMPASVMTEAEADAERGD